MTSGEPGLIHATTVALHGPDGWRGAMLTGASGAGKSDLALRLIARGWRLVADDYSLVWRSGPTVYATAPARIAGCIEARGLGIVPAPVRAVSRIMLVMACRQETAERLPEPVTTSVVGVDLPYLDLDIRPVSAVETVHLALSILAL